VAAAARCIGVLTLRGGSRQVNAALVKQLEKGTSFGAPCALEVRPQRRRARRRS
jgi:glutamate-1-semialdehyde aminotransferase